jgi:hypothetical protein
MSKFEIQPKEVYLIDDNGNEIPNSRKVIEYCVFNTASKQVVSCYPTQAEAKKARDIERQKEKAVEKLLELRNSSGGNTTDFKP